MSEHAQATVGLTPGRVFTLLKRSLSSVLAGYAALKESSSFGGPDTQRPSALLGLGISVPFSSAATVFG